MPEGHHGAFGQDAFGRGSERAARFFGTPRYIIGQTLVVLAWIGINSAAVALRWDPYPFILLNLAFSTQAAYAAPLILLAQTRQADRDKVQAETLERHHDEVARLSLEREEQLRKGADDLRGLLQANTDLTERVERLAQEIHAHLTRAG